MADRPLWWVVQGTAAEPSPPASADAAPLSHSYELLMVVPSLPYPPVWGFAKRAFELARHLARTHRVTVLANVRPDQGPDVEEISKHVHEVVAVVRQPAPLVQRRLLQSRNLLSRQPFHAAGLRTRALQSAVDETIARHDFDAVLLESSQMGWLSLPAGLPLLVDEHNIESELLDRMAQSESSALRRFFCRVEFRRYHRFEDGVWGASAACAATSPRDAVTLHKRRPDVPVAVVPNGVNVDEFRPSGAVEATQRLIFTGLLDYRPNYDGITWFLDNVFPLIQHRKPHVQLQIVGIGSPNALAALRRPGVDVTGRVPDLRAYLGEATVAIIPLRIGGGTRLKVVEAMSMGKAIVSTTLGAEGIDVVHEEQVLLADEPKAFADAVCRLLDEPGLRHRLGANARALAEEQYSWKGSADQLTALIERVVTAVPSRDQGRASLPERTDKDEGHDPETRGIAMMRLGEDPPSDPSSTSGAGLLARAPGLGSNHYGGEGSSAD